MASLILFMVLIAAVPASLVAVPPLVLTKFKYPALGMIYIGLLVTGVTIDYFYNWGGITYPSPWLAIFTELYSVTIGAAVVTFVLIFAYLLWDEK